MKMDLPHSIALRNVETSENGEVLNLDFVGMQKDTVYKS